MVALAAGCLVAVIAYNFLIELFTALRNIRLVSVMQLVNSVAFAVLGVGIAVGLAVRRQERAAWPTADRV